RTQISGTHCRERISDVRKDRPHPARGASREVRARGDALSGGASVSAGDGHIAANVERFEGFAELYDKHRPQPPRLIVDVLRQLCGEAHPAVVDIGSGTGLSTLIWTECAREVIGVEPGAGMRAQAKRRAAAARASNVRFVEGLSTRTSLADGC